MLCGLPTVQQAAIGDCLSFDPFSFDQNGLAPSEVDVGWRQIADAFVIAQVIVVNNEGLDLGFEIAREVIVFEQDTVLERLMPALDLSLGHRMIRRATDVLHVLAVEPFRQVGRDVAGAVVGEKPWPMNDLRWSRPEALSAKSSVAVTSSAFIVEHKVLRLCPWRSGTV